MKEYMNRQTHIQAAPAIIAFLLPTFSTIHSPTIVAATLTVPRIMLVTYEFCSPVAENIVVPGCVSVVCVAANLVYRCAGNLPCASCRKDKLTEVKEVIGSCKLLSRLQDHP